MQQRLLTYFRNMRWRQQRMGECVHSMRERRHRIGERENSVRKRQPTSGRKRLAIERGQSTIEAAFVAPILLGCILMLVQPCIVLYDRIVMQSAAGEACRLATTLNVSKDKDQLESFVKRRLGAIPQQDNFHVHSGGCTYEIKVSGGESSEKVSVKITNKLKPLPLIDFVCKSVGATDDSGCWSVQVESSASTQPDWVSKSPSGRNPKSWAGGWL